MKHLSHHLRGRGVIAAVAAFAVLATPIASNAAPKAKPKPACNLLTDEVDLEESKSLDIVSADVATNAKLMTTVIRVTDLGDTGDPSTKGGRQYLLNFKVDGGAVTTVVYDGPGGTYTNYGTAVLDEERNEVRWTAPLKEVEERRRITITPGRTKLASLTARTQSGITLPREIRDASGLTFVDGVYLDNSKAPTSSYLAGSPSCVRVG
jgi:hypothetical protein